MLCWAAHAACDCFCRTLKDSIFRALPGLRHVDTHTAHPSTSHTQRCLPLSILNPFPYPPVQIDVFAWGSLGHAFAYSVLASQSILNTL